MIVLNTPTHKIDVAGNPSDEPVRKPETERYWRDLELSRTDDLMLIPDYPQSEKDALTIYRQALRDYPSQPDFPNGVRPTV